MKRLSEGTELSGISDSTSGGVLIFSSKFDVLLCDVSYPAGFVVGLDEKKIQLQVVYAEPGNVLARLRLQLVWAAKGILFGIRTVAALETAGSYALNYALRLGGA